MKNFYVQEIPLIQTAAPLLSQHNELLPNFPRNAQLRDDGQNARPQEREAGSEPEHSNDGEHGNAQKRSNAPVNLRS
eukprot:5628251-Prymnesium_polylepis.1